MTTPKHYMERISVIDFMQGAYNVYRTPDFIVRQKLSFIVTKKGQTYMLSEDTYFYRTGQRNADYEFAFQLRDHLEGRRIHASTHIRHYVY